MRPVSRKSELVLVSIVAGLLPAGCASKKMVGPAASLESRTDLIPVGQKAPDFDAADQSGKRIRLVELLEKSNVVLIFYPGDFTPGCTRQLCAVRDDWSEFEKHGITVIGVNPADAAQHARFAGENRFPFSLIVDEGSRIAAAYGARGPERTERTVYAVRKDGKVALAERGFVGHERIFAALK